MIQMVAIIFSSLSLLVFAAVMWRVYQLIVSFETRLNTWSQKKNLPPELTQQIKDLNVTMGGMVQTLHAMGQQVKHLNHETGNALQDVQGQLQAIEEKGQQQILIEIHAHDSEDAQTERSELAHRRLPALDDMPPEMREKFLLFQAIYKRIMTNPDLPSREHPELN